MIASVPEDITKKLDEIINKKQTEKGSGPSIYKFSKNKKLKKKLRASYPGI